MRFSAPGSCRANVTIRTPFPGDQSAAITWYGSRRSLNGPCMAIVQRRDPALVDPERHLRLAPPAAGSRVCGTVHSQRVHL
jgi:hypothetical protein